MPFLEIKRADFLEALKVFKRLTVAEMRCDASLTFRDRVLRIEVGNAGTEVAAAGYWPGRAQAPGRFIGALVKVPPASDPVRLRVDKGRIYADGYSSTCVWHEAESVPAAEAPAASSVAELLALRSHYTAEQIGAFGLTKAMSAAEQERDRRLSEALQILKKFRVGRSDLERVLNERLKAPGRTFRENEARMVSLLARTWVILAPLGFELDDIRGVIDSALSEAWNR